MKFKPSDLKKDSTTGIRLAKEVKADLKESGYTVQSFLDECINSRYNGEGRFKGTVHVVFIMDEDDDFVLESIHATELGANVRMHKLSLENNWDKEDSDRYLYSEEHIIQGFVK